MPVDLNSILSSLDSDLTTEEEQSLLKMFECRRRGEDSKYIHPMYVLASSKHTSVLSMLIDHPLLASALYPQPREYYDYDSDRYPVNDDILGKIACNKNATSEILSKVFNHSFCNSEWILRCIATNENATEEILLKILNNDRRGVIHFLFAENVLNLHKDATKKLLQAMIDKCRTGYDHKLDIINTYCAVIEHIEKEKNIYHISTATECLELLKQIQESDKWKTAEESLLDAEKYDQNRYQAAKKTMKKVIKQINDLIKKEPSKQKCIIWTLMIQKQLPVELASEIMCFYNQCNSSSNGSISMSKTVSKRNCLIS